MAGDNNLSVDMAYALEQIKNVAGEGANLFVYYDGNSPSIPTLYCDFSEPNDPKYVPSFAVENKLYPVPQKRNENAADDKSVLNFVDWCVNGDGVTSSGRRANKYALIFSGHSLGFQDIGLFRDETSGKAMKMNDLYFALQRVVGTQEELDNEAKTLGLRGEDRDRETKVMLGKKLDILGFDSCVMGMLEVGYQFQVVADTMISSEGSVPSAGWTYAKILGRLAKEGGGSPTSVAESFVRDFIASQDSYTVGGVSVDMAAWDLNQFRDLTVQLDLLAESLLVCFNDPESRIYRQMERVILQVHWKCQSYMFEQNVDIGDFCELLEQECGRVIEELADDSDDITKLIQIQIDCNGVLESLRKAVILSGFSGGEYQYSNGISIFFPWSREGYEVSRKNYQGLWFARDAGTRKFYWNGFLKKYLNEVALRKFDEPASDVPPGAKYKYYSGVPFYGTSVSQNGNGSAETKIAGHQGSKIAGHQGSKIAGHQGSKIAGHQGSKIAGHQGSKIADDESSKIAGHQGSKIAGHQGSKIAGHQGSKIAGHQGSKIAGHQGSKIADDESSKIAGHQGSKIAGHQGSKIAGHQGSKIAGHQGSKIAGHQGSKLAGEAGSSAFFQNLQLFKNIESRWNISGFTKKSGEPNASEDERIQEGPSGD
jgi:hypothetical protein